MSTDIEVVVSGGMHGQGSLRLSEARGIVDGDMQMIPADPAFAAAPVAGDPVADAVDPAQAFDIEVDQFARSLALIAIVWLARLKGGELAQAKPTQDAPAVDALRKKVSTRRRQAGILMNVHPRPPA
jgi:hypothetical protein